MRVQDIKVGESYRHKNTPNYYYAKVIEILPPKKGINTNTYTVVKCEWSTDRVSNFGLIKYFKPTELVKIS